MTASAEVKAQDTLFELASAQLVPNRRRHKPRRPHASDQQLELPGLMVAEFHRSFDLPIAPTPTLDIPVDLLELRHHLLIEELRELVAAIDADDIVEVADALGDMVYVLYGTAVTFGIDLDAVVAAIHKSNMSKLGADGKPILRSDGKVLKGPNYHRPAIAEALGRASRLVSPTSDGQSRMAGTARASQH